MLKDAKHALGLAHRQRMVEGRSKVKKYDRRGEEARTNDKPDVPMPCCLRDEKGSSDECRDKTNPMANAVRNFLPLRLLTP
jgi:hypothetical protein